MNDPRLSRLLDYAHMLSATGRLNQAPEGDRFDKVCDAIEEELNLKKKK